MLALHQTVVIDVSQPSNPQRRFRCPLCNFVFSQSLVPSGIDERAMQKARIALREKGLTVFSLPQEYSFACARILAEEWEREITKHVNSHTQMEWFLHLFQKES